MARGRRRRQPDAACDIQVREFRDGQCQRRARRVALATGVARDHHLAARDLVLHLPRDLVPGRHPAPERGAPAPGTQLRALHSSLPATDCRADHPLQGHRRPDWIARATLWRCRRGNTALRPRPRQKDARGQYAGARRGPGIRHCARRAHHAGRVAGSRLLCVADLLRLFRLLGHGDRADAHVRISRARELQLSLCLAVGARILAAMAHLPVEFLPRLSVHPPGWETSAERRALTST